MIIASCQTRSPFYSYQEFDCVGIIGSGAFLFTTTTKMHWNENCCKTFYKLNYLTELCSTDRNTVLYRYAVSCLNSILAINTLHNVTSLSILILLSFKTRFQSECFLSPPVPFPLCFISRLFCNHKHKGGYYIVKGKVQNSIKLKNNLVPSEEVTN